MNKLTVDDYKTIAGFMSALSPEITWVHVQSFFRALDYRAYDFDDCAVMPKQRARAGNSGKHFTPKETREFERRIAKWGKAAGMEPVNYPISVELTIRDKTTDTLLRKASLAGLVYYQKNDLDNLEKAVLDGLNKVLYADDKQVISVYKKRRYSYRTGFHMTVQRAGLSKNEWEQLRKFL